LVRLDSRDHKGHRGPRVTREFRGPRDLLEHLGRSDLLEILVNLEQLEQADHLATLDSRDRSVQRDPLGHQDKLEPRDCRVRPGHRARRVKLDSQE
jgi:hypothetical protein